MRWSREVVGKNRREFDRFHQGKWRDDRYVKDDDDVEDFANKTKETE